MRSQAGLCRVSVAGDWSPVNCFTSRMPNLDLEAGAVEADDLFRVLMSVSVEK